MQLGIGELLGLLGGAFGLSTVVIGLLFRLLMASYREKTKQDIKAVLDSTMGEIKQIRIVVDQLSVDRDSCQARHQRDSEKLEAQVEKLREKWEVFVKDDAAMEATRGRKVEALFGVVDAIKGTVQSLPSTMHSKMDEMHRTSREELRTEMKKYVRDLVEDLPKG